jgi:hypothetical protein
VNRATASRFVVVAAAAAVVVMDGPPTRWADVTVAAELLVSVVVVGLLVPSKPGWWTLACRWNGAKVHETLSKDDVKKTTHEKPKEYDVNTTTTTTTTTTTNLRQGKKKEKEKVSDIFD